ncbi:MAG: ASPIC/UnbV domain-containing protein, partial [Fimbriimonadaceae bacterium]|nr:ASPIC/UnbV domain-containing protein [Chitinophagales bacterium]
LASVWEDFDNDGDLDCIVTNDGTNCEFYYSNNDGTFTKDATETFVLTNGNYYGASAGDYDRDGDVDLFISAVGSAKGLFENIASANGNNWVNFNVKGIGGELVYGTNRSALGVKIKLKAHINGNDVWQFREISAQNSFGSMNSLNTEFGLGDADIIDSLITIWPTGNKDTCTNIAVNNFYDINEIECPQLVEVAIENNTSKFNFEIAPNPATVYLNINITNTEINSYTIEITDISGKRIETLFFDHLQQGDTTIQYNTEDLAAGFYICKLSSGGNYKSVNFEVIK